MQSESGAPLHDIQLQEAWLADIDFGENSEFDGEAQIAENLSYTVESDSRAWLEPQPGAGLRVTISWQDQQGEPCEGPFRLCVVVHGWFGAPEGIVQEKGEQLQQWLRFMGPFLLWPYARAYIESLTSFSQFPSLTLFTLSLPRPRALEGETGEVPFDSAAGDLPPQ